uniref:hypothetical protein n=1 Tax=Flavobacterium sp. TaxID=239 RepID=UPI0040489ECC
MNKLSFLLIFSTCLLFSQTNSNNNLDVISNLNTASNDSLYIDLSELNSIVKSFNDGEIAVFLKKSSKSTKYKSVVDKYLNNLEYYKRYSFATYFSDLLIEKNNSDLLEFLEDYKRIIKTIKPIIDIKESKIISCSVFLKPKYLDFNYYYCEIRSNKYLSSANTLFSYEKSEFNHKDIKIMVMKNLTQINYPIILNNDYYGNLIIWYEREKQ